MLRWAENELDILARVIPDAAILPFKKEILDLVNAFGNSGQSGGSAPYTAAAITATLKKLLNYLPIAPILEDDTEWSDPLDRMEGIRQNCRCAGVFKHSDGVCTYVDAIIWQGEEEWDTFVGSVYADDTSFELVCSKQEIRFPFAPKTFYVDVVRVPITKEEAERRNLHYIEGHEECYYTVLKDPKQLEEVFKYYVK